MEWRATCYVLVLLSERVHSFEAESSRLHSTAPLDAGDGTALAITAAERKAKRM